MLDNPTTHIVVFSDLHTTYWLTIYLICSWVYSVPSSILKQLGIVPYDYIFLYLTSNIISSMFTAFISFFSSSFRKPSSTHFHSSSSFHKHCEHMALSLRYSAELLLLAATTALCAFDHAFIHRLPCIWWNSELDVIFDSRPKLDIQRRVSQWIMTMFP